MIIGNDSTRGSGWPKLTLDAVGKNDMNMIRLNLSEHLALDIAQWNKIIHVDDPNWLGQMLGLVWLGIISLLFLSSLRCTVQHLYAIPGITSQQHEH